MEALIFHICESRCAGLEILDTHFILYLVRICPYSQQFLACLDVCGPFLMMVLFPKAILMYSKGVFRW
jgi:hypothetical protein